MLLFPWHRLREAHPFCCGEKGDVRIYARGQGRARREQKQKHPLAPLASNLLLASPCSASQYARVDRGEIPAAPGCPITLNLAAATNGQEKVAAHRMINGRAYRQENNKSIRRALKYCFLMATTYSWPCALRCAAMMTTLPDNARRPVVKYRARSVAPPAHPIQTLFPSAFQQRNMVISFQIITPAKT